MNSLDPTRLRNVLTLQDVVSYLAEELDWPFGDDDLEDDKFFDWEPEELGLPTDRIPQLVSIRQLRPLESNQPWGIFFLEFEGPRLPITAMRRLLERLVNKKRATGGGVFRTWRLDDLLFIVNTDSGEAVELHFIAFVAQLEGPPEIRSLPWRPKQSPAQHLRRLSEELLPHLAWPDDPSQTEAWRAAWRVAFQLRHGEAIANASRLAERMATTAKALRHEIEHALAAEDIGGPFSALLAEVREQLVADATPAKFADMCAQTLVYGVLTSRISDPVSFGASPTLAVVPLSNPFLETFFENVHEHASVLDLEGIGLDELVADLRETNVEAILDEFGSNARGGDPVIHFYEEFLHRYDPKRKLDAGAFYTPQVVVEFMARTVDNLLRYRLGLAQGLADGSSWGQVAERNGFAVPRGIDSNEPFVSMVDPATGTGTFLVEWLRRARTSFLDAATEAEWTEHLREVVLPSIHAFEHMLGPYAVAHLKVALELHEQGITDITPDILLTDTLDHGSHRQLGFDDDPVSREGERAADLKNDGCFTVCIGNPPYDREQQVVGDIAVKRKGGIARFGVPGTPPLMKAVLDPLTSAGIGKHAKNAYNDYVYFWTWAVWQAITKQDKPGVVAFITASSYLDGVSLGGLRSHLRNVFDALWIVDLGGEGRGALIDENVFEIRTPVAIAFGIRKGGGTDACIVRYLKIEGTRAEKLNQLQDLDVFSAATANVATTGLGRLTPVSGARYHDWPEVTDLFPVVYPGVKAGRTWVIGESPDVLNQRITELIAHGPGERASLFKNSPTGRKAGEKLGKTNMPGDWERTPIAFLVKTPSISRYAYRSFDRQYVIADPRFLDRASAGWRIKGPDQVFFTTLTSTKLGAGPVITATPYVPDLDHFRGSYGAKNVIPLFHDGGGQEPNITSGLLRALSDVFGTEITPHSLAAYVYGLTATPAFAQVFATELGEAAGPVRIPLTADAGLFAEVAGVGEELLRWHTWGERFGDGDLPEGRATELQPVIDYPDTFRWEPESNELHVGGGRFGPVLPQEWTFEVSGFKVLQSWLGYRMRKGKGKKSSPLDDIRPEQWTFTPELLKLLWIIERTVALTPSAAGLLNRVLAGALVDAVLLPKPADIERTPRKERVPGDFRSTPPVADEERLVPYRPQVVNPALEEQYVNCAPLVSLQIAAGAFGAPKHVEDENWEWVAVESKRRLRQGMFVAQVVGKSMEPLIPDGSFCLFSSPVAGPRLGKIVLAQLLDALDPETGSSYTVKRYESQKSVGKESWQHQSISLNPVNPDFAPIKVSAEDQVQVIAEFLEVVTARAADGVGNDE